MLLSVHQRYMLELLRNVGCLRRDQMRKMLQQHFQQEDLHISENRLDAMLRQLRNFVGSVRLEGDLIRLDNVKPDYAWLEALDVMLELAGGAPPHYKARLPPPLLLRFILDDDATNIFVVAKWQDRTAATPVLAKQEGQRVIWLAENVGSMDGVTLPADHFIAVRQTDGTHRFYGSQEH